MARPKKGAVNPMPEATESAPGVFSVWKPLDQEFFLDVEFTDIATKLNKTVSEVAYTWDNEVQNGIDGHRLIGTISN